MISTEMEEGAGLSNQIWKYCVLRAISKKNNYDFGIINRHRFKGQHFLDIDYGIPEEEIFVNSHYQEKMTLNEFGKDVSGMDEGLLNVPDDTEISGTMQSLRYFEGISKEEICSWVRIRKPCWKLNACHVHIRGGDFIGAGKTLLPRQYFLDAMEFVRQKFDPIPFFLIITDHEEYARWLLPEIPIMNERIFGEPNMEADPYQASHHIGKNIPSAFKVLAASRCNIISNSSFSWWATYLNPHNPFVVAPAYWSAYNYDENFWSTNDMQVPEWNYLDKNGILIT